MYSHLWRDFFLATVKTEGWLITVCCNIIFNTTKVWLLFWISLGHLSFFICVHSTVFENCTHFPLSLPCFRSLVAYLSNMYDLKLIYYIVIVLLLPPLMYWQVNCSAMDMQAILLYWTYSCLYSSKNYLWHSPRLTKLHLVCYVHNNNYHVVAVTFPGVSLYLWL